MRDIERALPLNRRLAFLPAVLCLACDQPSATTAPTPAAPTPQTQPTTATATTTPTAASPATSPTPAPTPVPAGPPPYTLAWLTKLEGWTKGVDISGAGDPVFVVGNHVHLLARHDGSTLEHAQLSCTLRGRLRFINADTAVTACDDAIIEIGLPGLTVRRAYSVRTRNDERIEGLDVQATAVAYGTDGGTAVVLTRDAQRYVPSFTVSRDAKIESLALSPDVRTLVVGFEGRNIDDPTSIEIFDLSSGSSVATIPSDGRSRVTAMSFSPDGSMTFAHAGSFESGIIDVAAATWKRNYRVGSWVSETVWVRPDLVAGAGSDGISLFPVDGGDTIVLEVPGHQYPTMEAVGASDDGSMFCTGERDGTVGCWTNQPLAPSSYQPRAPLVR